MRKIENGGLFDEKYIIASVIGMADEVVVRRGKLVMKAEIPQDVLAILDSKQEPGNGFIYVRNGDVWSEPIEVI